MTYACSRAWKPVSTACPDPCCILLVQIGENACVYELAHKALADEELDETARRDITLSLVVAHCNAAKDLFQEEKVRPLLLLLMKWYHCVLADNWGNKAVAGVQGSGNCSQFEWKAGNCSQSLHECMPSCRNVLAHAVPFVSCAGGGGLQRVGAEPDPAAQRRQPAPGP